MLKRKSERTVDSSAATASLSRIREMKRCGITQEVKSTVQAR
jgi:hypothetical protein